MAEHSSSNLVCRICKDVFTNQTFLDRHFLDLHPTKTSYHCDYCNEDFISELFLQIHTTEYHSTPPKMLTKRGLKSPDKSQIKNIQAPVLNSKHFNSTGYLQTKVYNALAKNDDNLFWCPVCFQSFNKRENLRGHFRSSHTLGSGSIYVCELCDIEKPSAEMLCWHLEVHSNNRLSVNRFSKLRTCISSVKKGSTEQIKAVHKDTSNVRSGVIQLNDQIKLTSTENSFSGDLNTPEISLKTIAIPKHEKKGKGKANPVQKVTSSRLKLSLRKKQKILQLQLKAKSLTKRKLQRLYLRKLLLQVNDNTPLMQKDETEQNNCSEVISGSATEMIAEIAEEKSLHKPQDNSTKYGANHGLNDESDSISVKLLCGVEASLEVESTNDTTVTESSEIKLDHKIGNLSGESKVDTQPNFINDSQCYFEAKVIESSVNSHKSNGEDVSSNLKDKSTTKTLCSVPEKQSFIVKSILSKKGKSRFRNLRSSSCPTKRNKIVIINANETKKASINNDDSNVKYNNLESNKKAICASDANLTAEAESSRVTLVDDETLHPISSETIQHNNIGGSSQYERERKTLSVNVNDCAISPEKLEKIPESSKYKKESQSVMSNAMEVSKSEIPVITASKKLADKKLTRKIFTGNLTKKVQSTYGNTSKDSKTLHFENEKINKKKTNLKSILYDSSAKLESKVTNTQANLEHGSSEKDVFHIASDVISKTMSKKTSSEEGLTEIHVRSLEKSSTIEDSLVTVSETPVIDESEENSLSISPAVLENSINVGLQNKEPIENGSSSLQEVKTESTTSHSEASNDDQNSEDSINEANELFEEIPCDKCSLKFYNQDDLFDHLGTHYNI